MADGAGMGEAGQEAGQQRAGRGAAGRRQELVGAYVPAELAERFRAWARLHEGSASAAVRRLVAEAVEDAPVEGVPKGSGTGLQVGVRFRPEERAALHQAAAAQGTSPANWLRSLALVHLTRAPQWNPAELEALREVARELMAIGRNVNQVARRANEAAAAGRCPPALVGEAREAAELVRVEGRRLVGIMWGNWDRWGLPWEARPKPPPGGTEREAARDREAERQRKLRPRRRPKRFRDDDSDDGRRLSRAGERTVQDALRRALLVLPPQTPEQVRDLLSHARATVFARERAGEVFEMPGEAPAPARP